MSVEKKDTVLHDMLAERETVEANIDLVARFLEAVIEDPSVAEDIPDGATIFILPHDDPGRAETNFELAKSASKAGRDVHIWTTNGKHVGIAQVSAKWPEDLGAVELAVNYHWPSDELVVTFVGLYDAQRPIAYFARNPFVFMAVDTITHEVLGYTLPGFLERVISVSPRLLAWLDAAELRGISRDDLTRIIGERYVTAGHGGTAARFVEDVELAIASA